jgi:hypothetical protein
MNNTVTSSSSNGKVWIHRQQQQNKVILFLQYPWTMVLWIAFAWISPMTYVCLSLSINMCKFQFLW